MIEILRNKVFSLQACAPDELTDKDIELEVNRLEPSGTRGGWRIHRKGPDPVRVACNDHKGRVHLVLVC